MVILSTSTWAHSFRATQTLKAIWTSFLSIVTITLLIQCSHRLQQISHHRKTKLKTIFSLSILVWPYQLTTILPLEPSKIKIMVDLIIGVLSNQIQLNKISSRCNGEITMRITTMLIGTSKTTTRWTTLVRCKPKTQSMRKVASIQRPSKMQHLTM